MYKKAEVTGNCEISYIRADIFKNQCSYSYSDSDSWYYAIIIIIIIIIYRSRLMTIIKAIVIVMHVSYFLSIRT